MADHPTMPTSLARNPADREAGLQPVEAKPEDRRASERVKRARVARAVHGNAKLTAADVRKIRAMSASGRKCADVAREFGVAASTVSYIARGVTWQRLA